MGALGLQRVHVGASAEQRDAVARVRERQRPVLEVVDTVDQRGEHAVVVDTIAVKMATSAEVQVAIARDCSGRRPRPARQPIIDRSPQVGAPFAP